MKNKKITIDIETTGLNPWKFQLTCIGAKDNSGKNHFLESLKDRTEKQLITDFRDWLYERYKECDEKVTFVLVSHNGLKFDFPFILTRALLNDLKLDANSEILLNSENQDSITITKGWIKLDEYAQIYGLPHKTGNGRRAIELYKNGNFEELEKYCWQDVLITEKVNQKLIEHGVKFTN
ncbi:MAG TPA: ribonuclease H-like domain-containing protein [Candidatus Nanoarchaeia archaeon]|nr:ribonuclease H-like domain-containing protein [Candidatus Nanoarchaeia archaeon]